MTERVVLTIYRIGHGGFLDLLELKSDLDTLELEHGSLVEHHKIHLCTDLFQFCVVSYHDHSSNV